MNLAKKAMIVAMVSTLGLWGCAKGPTNGQAAERVKSLEAKIGKLEDDFRAVAAARDQIRAKLAEEEDQRNQLQQEIAKTQKDRETLRVQMATRTGERDALQVQYDQFRKAIKELVGQAEAGITPANPRPVTVAGPALSPAKS